MANYSFEKGKYGGPVGTIFPYFREISGTLPFDDEYREYVPAGFIKCRGQVVTADQFPELAAIIGVGNNCIYKKTNTTLTERNEEGTGGTMQLPDLGSKYITTASNPGLYNNDKAINPVSNQEVDRAGIGVSLFANGDSVDFGYEGNFSHSGTTLSFSGGWRIVSPPSRTSDRSLAITNFVAHGHTGSFTIGRQINTNSEALQNASWTGWKWLLGFLPIPVCTRSVSVVCSPDENFGVEWRPIDIGEGGSESTHNHTLNGAGITASVAGAIPAVTLSAGSLTTTVKVNARNLYKMDDISPKFVICEYLIKY